MLAAGDLDQPLEDVSEVLLKAKVLQGQQLLVDDLHDEAVRAVGRLFCKLEYLVISRRYYAQVFRVDQPNPLAVDAVLPAQFGNDVLVADHSLVIVLKHTTEAGLVRQQRQCHAPLTRDESYILTILPVCF